MKPSLQSSCLNLKDMSKILIYQILIEAPQRLKGPCVTTQHCMLTTLCWHRISHMLLRINRMMVSMPFGFVVVKGFTDTYICYIAIILLCNCSRVALALLCSQCYLYIYIVIFNFLSVVLMKVSYSYFNTKGNIMQE